MKKPGFTSSESCPSLDEFRLFSVPPGLLIWSTCGACSLRNGYRELSVDERLHCLPYDWGLSNDWWSATKGPRSLRGPAVPSHKS